MASDGDLRLERALRAAASLAAQDHVDGAVAALLEGAMQMFALDGVRALLVDPASARLHTVARCGSVEALGADDVTPGGPTLAGQAFTTRTLARSPGGGAWALPLVAGADVLGAVEGVRAPQLGDDELEALGGLAAVADATLARCAGGDADAERRRWTALRRASLAISDALTILPAAHMKVAVQRGFQLWPTAPDASIPESLHEVLHSIVTHARRIAHAQYAAIGIGEAPTRPFEFWAVDGVSAEMEKQVGRHPRPVGTLGVVARQGQVVRVPDVRRHPAFAGFPPHHPEVTSFLGVPVRYGGQSVGNLYLGNKIDAPEFTEEDQRSIEMLATNAALALQQTYLRAAIEAHQAQVHSILESAPHGILFVDARTGNVIANPRSIELLGASLDPKEGVAAYARLLRHPDGSAVTVDELASTRALRGESPPPAELVIVRPDGRQIPVMESAAPALGFGNRVLGAVVNFEEISAFKELERLREAFAAMVVHDLRNPVQTILIQASLLLGDEPVDPRIRRGVMRIADNARRLGRMANDLLDSARIELRQLELELSPAPLATATAAVLERLAPAIGSHALRLDAADGRTVVALDAARFDQILSNLIENAARFSPLDAPIDVRVAPATGGVIVSVEDHGAGIAPEEMDRLFDRFYQSKRARGRGRGLGLGLYICKGLVEAHGGRIWAESTAGRGSTFHVWLPAYEAAHASQLGP